MPDKLADCLIIAAIGYSNGKKEMILKPKLSTVGLQV